MWQLVFMINGYFISILSFVMLMVAVFDMYLTGQSWSHFLTSALISFFVGGSLFLSNRAPVSGINLKQGYLITVLSWTTLALLSTLPFMLYGVNTNFTDAFFEAMSGLTATGVSIFNDVEKLPAPILLWRSILNGAGGVGMVIFASALLPLLGIGGMQIFQHEASEIDKFMPKFHYIAKRIVIVYLLFNLACVVFLHFFGMNWFDAINHSMSAVATAGFSTKNDSIAHFGSWQIELVIGVFMIIGSLPMIFYIMLLQNKFKPSMRGEQIVTFFKVLSVYILLLSAWLFYTGRYQSVVEAFRYASFNVISVVTTTGLTSTNYMSWGGVTGTAFLIFALTGGCTGSTSGSIKIFRWQVLWAYLKNSVLKSIEPNRIMPVKVKQYAVDESVVYSVLAFMAMFFSTMAVLIVVLSFMGLSFVDALSSVVFCLTNTGAGVADLSQMSAPAKNILTFAMLLGRLEILTVLVVFTRSFWRK